MAVYFLLAASAYMLVYIAELIDGKEQGARRYLAFAPLIVLAVLFCFVAGIRADDVGTDLGVYGIGVFENAKHLSYSEFKINYPSFAPLVSIYFWIMGNIARSQFAFLFLIQVPATIVALAAVWMGGTRNRAWGAFCYALFLYPISLNLIRQSIAISFAALALALLISRKRVLNSLLMSVAAVLCHYSSIIVLIAYPIYFISRLLRNVARCALYLLMDLIILAVICVYPALVRFLASSSDYFALYGQTGVTLGGSALFVFAYHVVLISVYLKLIDMNCENEVALSYLGIVSMGATAYLFGLQSMDLYRPSLYFLSASILIPGSAAFRFQSTGQTMNCKSTVQVENAPLNNIYMVGKTICYLILPAFLFVVYFSILHQHEIIPFSVDAQFLVELFG